VLLGAMLMSVGCRSDRNVTLFDLAREGFLATDASFDQLHVERDEAMET
jgi:hypothetical protein